MYQKHEFIVKKDYPMAEDALEFVQRTVTYYLDVLKLFGQFSYTPAESMVYIENEGSHPYVTFRTEENETDGMYRIVIEEFWNNRFELQCLNPLQTDGFSAFADDAEVPQAVRMLFRSIDKHRYLQNAYAEHGTDFSNALEYRCTGRYFDGLMNGESAIGVFDPMENAYIRYGYGRADVGWTGKPLDGNIVDRSVLSDVPEKIWYPVNPHVFWRFLDGTSVNYGQAADEMFRNLPPYINALVQEDTEGDEFSDRTEIAYTYRLNDLWEDHEDEWEHPELKCRCMASMTGAEILSLLDALEHMNAVYLEAQRTLCKENDLNPAMYINEGFMGQMLFLSDSGEVLYAETGIYDGDGHRTGKFLLHCKRFF